MNALLQIRRVLRRTLENADAARLEEVPHRRPEAVEIADDGVRIRRRFRAGGRGEVGVEQTIRTAVGTHAVRCC
jgi:hypothetical protein